MFRAVPIKIYYAVLIATPEAAADVNWLRNFNCGLYLRSNSLNKKMDNFLLAAANINHKYIVVE